MAGGGDFDASPTWSHQCLQRKIEPFGEVINHIEREADFAIEYFGDFAFVPDIRGEVFLLEVHLFHPYLDRFDR